MRVWPLPSTGAGARTRSELGGSSAAKEAGATVKTSDLVDRTAQIPELGAMSGQIGQVFSMKQGETRQITAKLKKGNVIDNVNVEVGGISAPLVETTTSQVTNTFSGTLLHTLP